MTNNRKPVDEIRLSLSAAREDDSQPLHIATEGSLNQLPTKHRKGWTPAPTKPAYSQTNVSLAHKGRDYDAILRAAKREPVGYWEDAPRGIKFGGGGNTEKASGLTKAQAPDTTQNATAPTTTPPPQQSADSPWPKWLIADTYIRRFDGPMGGCVCYHRSGRAHPDPVGGWDLWSDDPRVCSQAEAVQWLEQNGHEDAVAQLLGKAICPQKPAQ